METSLHRELKRLYAGEMGRMEVRLGKFRVDAVVETEQGRELIEIQHGSLWSICDKIRRLTRRHRVRVVKPIVGRKQLVKLDGQGGTVVGRRLSPRQGRMLELFDELVHFTRAFPHRNLTLEVVLVDIEEHRFPSRKRRRRWQKQFSVGDRKLLAVRESLQIATADDLRQLIACPLQTPFDTAQLATGLEVHRFDAQRIAYVLRKIGSIQIVGKRRGAWLYEWNEAAKSKKAA